jgi:hypothetical protein
MRQAPIDAPSRCTLVRAAGQPVAEERSGPAGSAPGPWARRPRPGSRARPAGRSGVTSAERARVAQRTSPLRMQRARPPVRCTACGCAAAVLPAGLDLQPWPRRTLAAVALVGIARATSTRSRFGHAIAPATRCVGRHWQPFDGRAVLARPLVDRHRGLPSAPMRSCGPVPAATRAALAGGARNACRQMRSMSAGASCARRRFACAVDASAGSCCRRAARPWAAPARRASSSG